MTCGKSRKMIMENTEGFRTPYLIDQHKVISEEVYKRLPLKVKRLIVDKGFQIDYFHEGIVKSDENEVAYFIKPCLIDINKHHPKNQDFMALKGTIAHEVAHGFFYHTSPFIKKLLEWKFKIKYRTLPQNIKDFYKNVSGNKEPYHELMADCLASEWGFSEEIKRVRS